MSNHNYSQYSNKQNNLNKQYQPRNNFQQNSIQTPIKPVEKSVVEPVVKMESTPVVEQPRPEVKPVSTPDIVQSKPQLVQETLETKPIPSTVAGMVVGCAKLNVREEANLFAEIVCVLNAQSEIEIDVNKSNKDWFYITTATGLEGYCMRKYVEAHL